MPVTTTANLSSEEISKPIVYKLDYLYGKSVEVNGNHLLWPFNL